MSGPTRRVRARARLTRVLTSALVAGCVGVLIGHPTVGGVASAAAPADPAATAPAGATTAGLAAVEPGAGAYTPVMVVMDTSGSMNDPARSGGRPKIEGARAAVNAVASAVGPNQLLGVIAYPGTSGSPGGSSCSPGDVVVPLGAPDPARTAAAVRHLQADGPTPTSAALEHAGQVLTASGADVSVAVLVSDGEANCGPPVCDTAKKLLTQGVHVTINTVGFDIADDADAQDDLRCVAQATGGTYTDAGDAAALSDALLRAAASYLELTTSIPTSASAVTGTSAGLGASATVTVTNTGQQAAQDVQVSLDFAAGKKGGAVPMDKSVQSVGNLAPGANRAVTFRLRPASTTVGKDLSWLAAATTADGRGAQASGLLKVVAPGSALGAVLDVKGPIVVVGDSYSSGEGAGSYLSGDAGPAGTACHRSNLAYAAALYGAKRVTNLACSGAVTSNFGRVKQSSGGKDVEYQSAQLEKLADGPNPPALVLLSFGGNDIGFSGVVKLCVGLPRCGFGWQARLDAVPSIVGDLTLVYEQIDSQVNGPEALAKRGGRVAPIVVMPYVRIVPQDDTNAPGGCFLGFSNAEVKFLNQLLNKLNATIRRAVQEQARAGRPFYLADDVVDAFQPDHTVCDDSSRQYAKTYRELAFYDNVVSATARLGALNALGVVKIQELAHPNAAGYTAESQALAGWSQHTTLRPVTGKPLWDPLPLSDHPLLGGIDIGVGDLQPAGGTVTVQGSGFVPGSEVLVRLQSVPRTVGTATVKGDGTVDAVAPIPFTTSVGVHHVVLSGFDTDGNPREVSHGIRVLPQLTGLALLVLVVGLALVGYWAWSSRRRAAP